MKLNEENLRNGLLLTIRNAQELIDEAEILLNNQKYARGYALSYFAIEETSKCTMLLKALSFKIWNEEISEIKVRKRYFSHKEKIQNFKLLQILTNKFTCEDFQFEDLNTNKNDSLYVNWDNENVFSIPNDKFSIEKSTTFFNDALSYVKLITILILTLVKDKNRFYQHTLEMKNDLLIQEIVEFEKTENKQRTKT